MRDDATTGPDLKLADGKTGAVLGACFGVLGAATMPFLLELVPPEHQELPLPLPWFALALIPVLGAQYGFFAFLGCRATRRAGLEPAPVLTAFWTGAPRPERAGRHALEAFGLGLAAGACITAITAGVQWLDPSLLPSTLHPGSIPAALGASASAAVGEEILTRLLLLGVLAWALGPARSRRILAVTLSALIFGAMHTPAMIYLFGGFDQVPFWTWGWLLLLNGVVGGAAGWAFLRAGVGAAVLVHFAADLVWHVGSVAFGG